MKHRKLARPSGVYLALYSGENQEDYDHLALLSDNLRKHKYLNQKMVKNENRWKQTVWPKYLRKKHKMQQNN